MTEIRKRYEIVFVYDVKDANPNGDPDDENRPRRDLEGYNIVTDVRLKRTIRDYWLNHGKDILIQRKLKPDGTIKNIEDLVQDYCNSKNITLTREVLNKNIPDAFIDVKMFGLTAAVTGNNVSITGPVQFGIGKSLNKPNIIEIPITSVMSAGIKTSGGAMGTTQILDYSLIAFNGVICPHTAKIVGLQEEDIDLLLKGLWWGTKTLNTRSKFNHIPRLLILLISKDSDYLIGNLASTLKNKDENSPTTIEFSDFIQRIKVCIKQHAGLEKIKYMHDPATPLFFNNKSVSSLEDIIKTEINIPVEQMNIKP